MKRLRALPIRARLAIAFSTALLVVLVLSVVFVYLRVDAELTDSAREGLRTRLAGLQALVEVQGPRDPALRAGSAVENEDGFSQVLTPSGEVVASKLRSATVATLDPAAAARAAAGATVRAEAEVPGVEGTALILAGPASDGTDELAAVVGVSTQDRTEALNGIVGAFAIGAPIALLLAAGAGLALARRALQPVEAMRARAEAIGGDAEGERLPLPEADDEIHALGETLNSMLDRLEVALQREREFVADASHELRTPLAILKAELELAQADRGLDAGDLRAAIGSAQDEVDRLTRLADDLLIAARADRGEISIRRETVDPQELVARVVARFARTIEGSGRVLRAETADAPAAELDPLRVEQIIANLIDNAIRHGEGGVLVRVLPGGRDDGSIVVAVSDEGPGLPPEFAESAFERFSRPDSGRSGGGAGLGLAIVRALARAHGGDAEIAIDDPATIRVVLPPS
jgi:signal transduction histidine kinase